jgi:hypothetical protein
MISFNQNVREAGALSRTETVQRDLGLALRGYSQTNGEKSDLSTVLVENVESDRTDCSLGLNRE